MFSTHIKYSHRLTIIQVNPIVKEIYDYVMMDIRSNGCFVTNVPFMNGGHDYDFPSSVGHTKSD
jgi:hypothetical protein